MDDGKKKRGKNHHVEYVEVIFQALSEALRDPKEIEKMERKFGGSVLFIIHDCDCHFYMDAGQKKPKKQSICGRLHWKIMNMLGCKQHRKTGNYGNDTKGRMMTMDEINTSSISENVDLIVTMGHQTLVEIVWKRSLNYDKAFICGKLKVLKGSLYLAMKLNAVIRATRRHLPTRKPPLEDKRVVDWFSSVKDFLEQLSTNNTEDRRDRADALKKIV